MASLYELNLKLATYEMEFDEETGEWLNENELDAIHMEREEKIENICLWVKNLRAEVSAIKAEEKALADRRKAKEKKADRLEEYVASNLGGKPFETSRVKVSYRKSESVNISNEDAVPERFLNIEVVRKPIKAEIKKYLKECEAKGKEVPWANLEQKNNMSIK